MQIFAQGLVAALLGSIPAVCFNILLDEIFVYFYEIFIFMYNSIILEFTHYLSYCYLYIY